LQLENSAGKIDLGKGCNMLTISCPHCRKTLSGKDELAGRAATCSACKTEFKIPLLGVKKPESESDPLYFLHSPQKSLPDTQTLSNQSANFTAPNEYTPNTNTKYCYYCGAVIASLAEICPKCGVRQPSMPGVVGQVSTGPNKVVACLFALFLGLLGAHKFYLGQTMWGVFYLLMNILLFWTFIVPIIFSIICLIEGLTYLSYSDVDFVRAFGRH
jgi:TM2 domain-containing membrane protein YozV